MSSMMNLDEWLLDKEITPDILVKMYGFRRFHCDYEDVFITLEECYR